MKRTKRQSAERVQSRWIGARRAPMPKAAVELVDSSGGFIESINSILRARELVLSQLDSQSVQPLLAGSTDRTRRAPWASVPIEMVVGIGLERPVLRATDAHLGSGRRVLNHRVVVLVTMSTGSLFDKVLLAASSRVRRSLCPAHWASSASKMSRRKSRPRTVLWAGDRYPLGSGREAKTLVTVPAVMYCLGCRDKASLCHPRRCRPPFVPASRAALALEMRGRLLLELPVSLADDCHQRLVVNVLDKVIVVLPAMLLVCEFNKPTSIEPVGLMCSLPAAQSASASSKMSPRRLLEVPVDETSDGYQGPGVDVGSLLVRVPAPMNLDRSASEVKRHEMIVARITVTARTVAGVFERND